MESRLLIEREKMRVMKRETKRKSGTTL